jgi:hypothetical protein
MKKLLITLMLLLGIPGLVWGSSMRFGPFDPSAARKNLSNVDPQSEPSFKSLTLSEKVRAAWAEIANLSITYDDVPARNEIVISPEALGDLLRVELEPGANNTGMLVGRPGTDIPAGPQGSYMAYVRAPSSGTYNHALGLEAGKNDGEILHLYSSNQKHIARYNTWWPGGGADNELEVRWSRPEGVDQFYWKGGPSPFMVIGADAGVGGAGRLGTATVSVLGGLSTTESVITPSVRAAGSGGLSLKNSNGDAVMLLGAGPGLGVTTNDGLNVTGALGVTGHTTGTTASYTAVTADTLNGVAPLTAAEKTQALNGTGTLILADSSAGNQTIASAAWILASFTTEVYDELGEFSDSTFTAAHAGIYLVEVQVYWINSATGGYRGIELWKNSTTLTPRLFVDTPGAAVNTAQNLSRTVKLAANDTIKVYVTQTSDSALTIVGAATTLNITAIRRL